MEEQRQAELKRKLDAELAAKKASTNEVRVDNISYFVLSEIKATEAETRKPKPVEA